MNGSMKGRYGDYKGTLGQKERFKDARHDPYQARAKAPDPSRCPRCGVVYVKGRWSWQVAPEGAREEVCPACRRIEEGYPAGFIDIKGPFLEAHRQEILNLICNTEAAEKQEHPLERLMAVQHETDLTVITTTGVHLARRIGEALADAYQGQLSFQYGESDAHIRVAWER